MQVFESARKQVSGLLGSVEEIDGAVLRGERQYHDKTFAIAYVDFADDIVGRSKGLRAFQERILGDGFFSSPGDLRWNKYIYFIAGPNSRKQEGFREAKNAIEADEEYARKRVISEDELASALGAAQYFVPTGNAQEFDIVAEWGKKLAEASLDSILDRPVRTSLIEQIGDGKAQRASLVSKTLTLHKSDALLHSSWISKLRIEKFRRIHDDKEPFEFGQVNLITGSNGTGKTSLLEAIEYFYCGQNRRYGPSFSKVFATLRGSKSELASTTEASRLRARCLKWYNREERTSSGVLAGFDRYNFLDTDATFRVTSELNAEALPEDLSRLIAGPEASQLWAYIGKLLPDVEIARDRSFFKLQQAQSLESDAKVKLKELQERPSNAKSLSDSFRASLSTIGWKGNPSKTPLVSADDGIPLQAAQEHVQILLAAGGGLPNLGSLRARWTQVDQAFNVALPLHKEISDLNEEAKGLQGKVQAFNASANLLERWTIYVGSRFSTVRSEYLSCKARVDKAMAQVGVYANSNISLVNSEFSNVRLVDAISSAIQNESSVTSQINSLEQLSSAYGQAASTRARIAQELTMAVKSAMADGAAKDICPVCKTKHTTEELARHIDRITADLEQPAELASIANQLSNARTALQGWKDWQSYLRQIQQIATQLNLPLTTSCGDIIFALQQLRNELAEANFALPIATEKWIELERLGLTENEHAMLLSSVSAERLIGQNPYEIDAINQRLKECQKGATSAQDQLLKLRQEQTELASSIALLVEELISPTWKSNVVVGNDFQAILALRQELEPLTNHADALRSQLDIDDKKPLADVLASIAGALRSLANATQAAIDEQSASTEMRDLSERITEQGMAVRSLLLQHMNFHAAVEALKQLSTELSLEQATKKSLDAIANEINAAFVRIHSPNEYEYVGDGEVLLRSRDNQETWSLDRVSTGQRSAFALSVFLALNRTATNAPPILLIDDPVAHVDDLNALSFLDYLRDLAVHSKRQIFFATADTKIASLFARKFGFLGDDFKRIDLVREPTEG